MGWINDDNRTNWRWQWDEGMMTTGRIDEWTNWQWKWDDFRWGGDKFTITTCRLMSGQSDNEKRMTWQWRGEKLTMMTGRINDDDRKNQQWQGNDDDDEGVLNCNHVHCDGHDCDGSQSWWCLIAITLAAMVLSHDGAGSQWCSIAYATSQCS